MKRILLSIIPILGISFCVNAQSTIDLKITNILSPLNNGNLPNCSSGDSVYFKITLTNEGSASISPGDSIFMNVVGPGVANDGVLNYILQLPHTGISLAQGQSTTIDMYIQQGANYGNGTNGPVITNFPSNTTATYTIFVYGRSSTGTPYSDIGYDPSQSGTNAVDPNGNNYLNTTVTFGTPTYSTVDLELSEILSPLNNAQLPNCNNGDSLLFSVKVKNLGSDSVKPGDTVFLNMFGKGIATNGTTEYILYSSFTNLTLAPSQSDTLNVYIKQGANYGTDSVGNIITNFPFNSLDTFMLFIYGHNSSGLPFIDIGYDTSQTGTDAVVVGGNNYKNTTVIFGTVDTSDTPPTGIFKITNLDNPLSIFPNPAISNVYVKYIFTNNTEATIRVVDVTGRTVITNNLGKQGVGERTFNINTSDLANGIYTIELVTDKTRAISQFTISSK